MANTTAADPQKQTFLNTVVLYFRNFEISTETPDISSPFVISKFLKYRTIVLRNVLFSRVGGSGVSHPPPPGFSQEPGVLKLGPKR